MGWMPTGGGATGATGATGAGSASGLTLIANQLLASPAVDISFAFIPATYSHLLLVCSAVSASGSADYYKVTVNSLTSGYAGEMETWNNGGTAVDASGGDAWYTSVSPRNDLPGSGTLPGLLRVTILNYASATFGKIAEWVTGQGTETSIATMTNTTTTAISQIDVFTHSGSGFRAGSLFSLYGMA